VAHKIAIVWIRWPCWRRIKMSSWSHYHYSGAWWQHIAWHKWRVSAREKACIDGSKRRRTSHYVLDIWADCKTIGEIKGEICFNGASKWRSAAYVAREKIFTFSHHQLSDRQSLYFAAWLSLPKNWPHEGKEKRMNKMLDIGHVGLVHDNAAHRVIETSKEGDIRDILAGQWNRLSIGVEMIILQNILFLNQS